VVNKLMEGRGFPAPLYVYDAKILDKYLVKIAFSEYEIRALRQICEYGEKIL